MNVLRRASRAWQEASGSTPAGIKAYSECWSGTKERNKGIKRERERERESERARERERYSYIKT